MSRIGKKIIEVPEGVKIDITQDQVNIKGVRGILIVKIPSVIKIEMTDNIIEVKRKNEEIKSSALHGLTRSLIYNAVIGVSTGWTKILQLVGVGFRAQTDGNKLTLNLGFSHPVIFQAPEGVSFKVEGNNITVEGFDKQSVGDTAAKVRKIKKPDVYKGKGIRYKDEVVRKKEGKSAKAVGASFS